MKKKNSTLLLTITMASSIPFLSCIGSSGLTNKLLTWNRSIDSKLVNELVFTVFWIVPVYEISALADVLMINLIEFWSRSNPAADVGNVKTIDGKDDVYTVEAKVDGYHIQKEGDEKTVDLVSNEADQSWNIEASGESTKLLKFNGDDEVTVYLPDDEEMNVELNRAGVLAFQQVADEYSYYVAK